MPTVRLNGSSLYYEMGGTGTTLIFVHGCGWTHHVFTPQQEYFSKYYQVIVCDLRGNGQSGKLLQAHNQVVDTQCLDLVMLMNMLHIREAVFVGVSYGGVIVQQMAVQYPERVKAVVIGDSYCQSGGTTMSGAMQVAAAYFSWFTDYAPAQLLFPSLRLMYRNWDLAYRELRMNMLNRRSRELYQQRVAISRIDYSSQLTHINQPVLCLVGDYSEYNVRRMRELNSYLLHGRLIIIPDACDPSNLCQPETFNAMIQRFLDQEVQEVSSQSREVAYK